MFTAKQLLIVFAVLAAVAYFGSTTVEAAPATPARGPACYNIRGDHDTAYKECEDCCGGAMTWAAGRCKCLGGTITQALGGGKLVGY